MEDSAPLDSSDEIVKLLRGRRFVVLSGAGISTESGIPDYRGPGREKEAVPIQLQEFLRSGETRQRYWARSAVGWPWITKCRPNDGHAAVARLEHEGVATGVITQNVDGLHQAAGSSDVVELHGALRAATCLDCGRAESRAGVQERITVLNPAWHTKIGKIAPDGDVHLTAEETSRFTVPACLHCGGTLKPDVVFFGESVPTDRVRRAFDMLAASDGLLVVGSSLTVYSGLRFVDRAHRDGTPIAIINDGPTRGDKKASVKLNARLGPTLSDLAEKLSAVNDPRGRCGGHPERASHAPDGRSR